MQERDSAAIETAIGIAVRSHIGQRDKKGLPYILHPLTLAVNASTESVDVNVIIAALLHDVIEDTSATIQSLIDAEISRDAIDAIQLLTHTAELSYADYVVKLKPNRIARTVKLLDLHDNYRLNRVAYRREHSQMDATRLQKYILTKQYLQDEISESHYRQSMSDLED